MAIGTAIKYTMSENVRTVVKKKEEEMDEKIKKTDEFVRRNNQKFREKLRERWIQEFGDERGLEMYVDRRRAETSTELLP